MLDFIKKIFGGQKDNFESLPSKEFDQALKQADKKMILDVRHKHEFDEEKLRNAVNLDVMMPNFKDKVQNLDPNKTYFVYCQSGRRSARACRIMAEHGFENLVNLKGGIVQYEGKTV